MKNKIRLGLLLAVMSTVLLTGCITTGSDAIAQDDKVASIKIGKTTVSEVEAMFGKPAQISLEANGERTYMYYRNQLTAKAWVPFLNAMGDSAKTKHLHIRFNRKGIVTDVATTEGSA